ncbi:helix-turn-helix transcriptional regulator [Bradyrhizobium japonicum]|uniref:helix-turn-helix transcriptional regulator n=1 Tax=Bradyrhizobium japonicum TaxID=375 RepID=UPI001CB70F70|nr:helix-turn-helix transcriptional regulator [Bradyrhizobium japonicum]
MCFPQSVVSLSVAGRDEYLNKLLQQYVAEALERKPLKRLTVRSKVEDILSKSLPHGKLKATEVARQLGISSRTFSRKLSEEKITFDEILDQLRATLAKRYLRDERLRISTIAWLLGYGGVSSLTHAFRRWTGVTPRKFRALKAPELAGPAP